MKKLLAVVSLFASTLMGCATMGFYGEPSGYLSNEAVLQRASAGPLETSHARVITDNDESFQSKLELIEGAR
ncbi:MAG: hypothetical protein LM549_01325, partial [Candidatus Competibacter sp.]|nr:hypothetical protein [Candidatus Competibacter sp.]